MEEREEKRKQELLQELQWVKYRQEVLDNMEESLLQMKQLAENAKQGNYTEKELEEINVKLKDLARRVSELDSESRKIVLMLSNKPL